METKFVQAGPVRLQYFEYGSGPEVVVLVHGYAGSGRIWRLTQEALDPALFRTIAFNNRGAGDSDRTSNEDDYSIQSFARDLHAAVQALGLRDFTLAGHSLGVRTVTQYALDHPEMLKALVLLDGGGLTARSYPAGWEDELRRSHQAGGTDLTYLGVYAPGVPADFRAAIAADVDNNPIERLIGSRRSAMQTPLHDRAAELRMPVLVAGGDKDGNAPIESQLATFLALSKDIRSLHVFHGAGHSPNVERATECAAVLDRFITHTVVRMLAPER